jgi:hypothetical protein
MQPHRRVALPRGLDASRWDPALTAHINSFLPDIHTRILDLIHILYERAGEHWVPEFSNVKVDRHILYVGCSADLDREYNYKLVKDVKCLQEYFDEEVGNAPFLMPFRIARYIKFYRREDLVLKIRDELKAFSDHNGVRAWLWLTANGACMIQKNAQGHLVYVRMSDDTEAMRRKLSTWLTLSIGMNIKACVRGH